MRVLILLFSIPFFLNCNGEETATPVIIEAPIVQNISVEDISNNGDGSDMHITFDKVADESLISEYRIFVVNQIDKNSFDLTVAENVSSGNYISIMPDGNNKELTLDALSKDTGGQIIENNKAFYVYILTIADGINATVNSLSSPSIAIILKQDVVKEATDLKLLDVANSANASDIELSFSLLETSNIKELRLFVMAEEDANSFDLAMAEGIVQSNYTVISTSNRKLRLAETAKDIDGNLIVEAMSYKAFILTVAEMELGIENVLSKSSTAITLEQKTVVSTLASNVPGGSGGIALDADGNIYMGDFGQTLGGQGNQVFKISPKGEYSVFATGFFGASGNDFDSQGNLFQSNINGATISKITPAGAVSTFSNDPDITNPVGIYIDENDELLVADCEGYRILKINKDGEATIFSASTLLNCPNGITRDDDGNIYTSNFYNANVIKITPTGEASIFVTLPVINNGHITFHDGFLYVIARTENRIYKVSLDGEFEVFAGSGQRGSKDGDPLEATFSLPNDLVFSEDGKKLYINDVVPTTGNNIAPCNIRVIDIVE